MRTIISFLSAGVGVLLAGTASAAGVGALPITVGFALLVVLMNRIVETKILRSPNS